MNETKKPSFNAETDYSYANVLARAPKDCPTVTPIVETLGIKGVPAADVIAEQLAVKLQSLHSRDLPAELSEASIFEAIHALIAIRVMQVRHQYVKGHEFLHFKTIIYPALFWPIVRAIGDVLDLDDGIELRVELEGDMVRFKDQNYPWTDVEKTLRALHTYGSPKGLEFAYAMPKGKDGQVSVISFTVDSQERLRSHTSKKGAPDGLVRAAIDYRFGSYVWGSPRWEYNSISWYKNQFRYVVDDAFRSVSC